ncbi:MAG: histidine phosphatase family protein [bacterium]
MTAQTCTLYLVRHGQTQWNIDQTIQGHTDIPLTKIGEQQAYEQQTHLKNISFTKIYSSDLIRAHKTAQILNLERSLAIQTTQTLRERNFGSYQGRPIEEGRKKLWDLLANYKEHPHVKASGVETNEQVIGRSLTFLREVSVAHPGQNILVVTHGGIMRLILLHLGYVKEGGFPHNAIQNLAYIQLECDGIDFKVKETFGITLHK